LSYLVYFINKEITNLINKNKINYIDHCYKLFNIKFKNQIVKI
jgi:hypothetical protein